MDFIKECFAALTSFLGYWLPKIWDFLKIQGIAIWGVIVGVVTLLWVLITHLIPMVALMLNTLAGLTTGTWHFTFPSFLTDVFALGNTLLPLDEFFQYLVAYGTLITSLALYRFIKNLIPTEAGT